MLDVNLLTINQATPFFQKENERRPLCVLDFLFFIFLIAQVIIFIEDIVVTLENLSKQKQITFKISKILPPR